MSVRLWPASSETSAINGYPLGTENQLYIEVVFFALIAVAIWIALRRSASWSAPEGG
jgi:hypothetical protein